MTLAGCCEVAGVRILMQSSRIATTDTEDTQIAAGASGDVVADGEALGGVVAGDR
jgi:hypothetical protein